ncbi:T9SS type A sorting domain-containing protein [Mesonia sp.]|uniref:DUF7619 domain-containing protein n=1 Tax=Mesonia sp. TaxID=1960830 RepID=UPI0017538CBA|nr:T9SS type A sorting domain-containing protein [Mesonia sp.]HIB37804.1 T9SS type A sorting domain-containing protein [Mesonia sp.]HIO26076.1 T9SS type A sorting domain-containing protein [Flavobacteriaceae bacterium]
MKTKLLFLCGVFSIFCGLSLGAQNVNIPDANLKTALVNHSPTIDTNSDGEIQVTEATNYNGDLILPGNNIEDVTGLEYFNNINVLNLDYNNISDFSLNGLTGLTYLTVRYNNLTSIDVSALSSIESLVLRENDLTSLDVSNNPTLEYLNVRFNPLVELDVSYNVNLEEITLSDLDEIEYINLKNGNNANMTSIDPFSNMPAIEMVCVDDETTFLNNLYDLPTWGQPWFLVTTDCNFAPGQLNNISGTINLDAGSGCGDASAIAVPNMLVETSVDGDLFGTLTNENGAYSLYTDEGINSAATINNWPNWLSINPPTSSTTFAGFGNFTSLDFCVNAPTSFENLSVVVLPINDVIPGSMTTYEIVVENLGSGLQSGSVTLTYDDAVQSYVSASVSPSSTTTNTLSFDFSNLEPFHTQKIQAEFQNENNSNLTVGDEVTMTAEVFPNTNDVDTEDNLFETTQTVVANANANYKQVLEGAEIYDTDLDQFLHYVVRFQNTGAGNVQNLKIRDTLNENLDWSSFRMVSASHSNYRVEIEGGNAVEFSFDDIDLPYASFDDAGSRGYLAFMVKPNEDAEVGDFILGESSVYFDFDPPMFTNQVSTEIVENLSVASSDFSAEVNLYPNPTSGLVSIQNNSALQIENVEVYSITGQKVLTLTSTQIDLSTLNSGVYFVKLIAEEGTSITKKVVKQ